MKKIVIVLLMVVFVGVIFMGCDTQANVASRNLSKAADSFEIYRRAVFYDGINGEAMLMVEGYLSINDQGNQLEVTVKNDNGTYLKHFLGLSDNVTYFVEQLDPAVVSDKHYRVIWKPSTIIPNIDIQ